MEPQEPQNQPQDAVQPENLAPGELPAEPMQTPPVSPPLKKKSPLKLFLLLGGGVTLIVGILIGLFVANNHPKQTPSTNTTNATTEKITPSQKIDPNKPSKDSSQILVYGVWSAQSSVIKSLDLTHYTTTELAVLPLDIRKVTILNPSTVMYIDQTDSKDHGKRLTFFNMHDKTISNGIALPAGYLLYDYLLSPDKKYLVLWEVKPGPEGLTEGQSRIYAVDMTNYSINSLLYDEPISATIPAHYPRAILDNGTVITDTFLPNSSNSDINIAYGMSTVDFDGTNRKDIDAMVSGTYSSAPLLSPDGGYVLFTGYDGSKGDGNSVVNGFRQALLVPNTVELLNTKSLKRFRLPNVPNDKTYTQVAWDQITANVIMTELAPDTGTKSYFSYDLAKQAMKSFDFPTSSAASYIYVSQLPGGVTLAGTPDNQPANFGNLGDNYAYALTKLELIDSSKKQTDVPLQDQFLQYMSVLPGNYFK